MFVSRLATWLKIPAIQLRSNWISWISPVLLSLGVLVYLLWEQRATGYQQLTPGILLEVLFFGVAFPIISFAVGLLYQKNKEQNFTLHDFDALHELERKIANIQDWEQLVLTLVAFPSTIAPISRVVFLIYDKERSRFKTTAVYGTGTDQTTNSTIPFSLHFQPFCRLARSSTIGPISCGRSCVGEALSLAAQQNLYCLPLFNGDTLLGMLHLYISPGETINPDQARLMKYFVPLIVMAIKATDYTNEEITSARILEAERRQIARHIHDTLGHNLAFMQFKLDQLIDRVEAQEFVTLSTIWSLCVRARIWRTCKCARRWQI